MKNKIIIFTLFLIVPIQIIRVQACSGASIPANAPTTINGVTVTPTLSGNATTYTTAYTDCGSSTHIGAAWLNNNTSTANTGTVTYTFSKPVNNVVARFNASSFVSIPAEVITISTNNGGTVTTIPIILCNVTKSSNSYTATGTSGGAELTITSTIPYTSLTINDVGNNQNNGSLVELCASSIVAFSCNAGNIAPGIQ